MNKMREKELKKVLVVDDSAFMRRVITDMLNSHSALEVVATARNGIDAIGKVLSLEPDVITLDVEMPLMNGLDALQEIMKKRPTPVVMLSSTTDVGAQNTMLAMEYGAVDFVAKPGGAISLNLPSIQDEILEKVVEASRVQITKLHKIDCPKKQPMITSSDVAFQKNRPKAKFVTPVRSFERKIDNTVKKMPKVGKTFVMIGTSTGGPRALQAVLTQIPKNIGAPILIVQHMPAGFTKSLADRLNTLCEIDVREATDGEVLEDGVAYIAPGGKHLKMKKVGTSYIASVADEDAPRYGHRPSVDVLLESAAQISGVNFITVIMTGMGYDGREGMKILRERCPVVTIAESSTTSVVYGMPKAIIDHDLADHVVDLPNISKYIVDNI